MNLQEVIAALGQELGIKTHFTVVILTLALLLCRIMPILFFSPFLGGEIIPNEVKMGIGVTLGIVLFPAVASRVDQVPVSALVFLALVFKELFIGFCLAFIGIGFEVAQMSGGLIDMASGSNMAQVHVPQIGERVTLFSSLKVQLAIVFYLTLNGHHVILEAFTESLIAIPLDKFPAFSSGSWPLFDMVLRAFADLLPIAIALAAPAVVATFLTDLALGMINRVAPQIQVFFISMSVKPIVAALMMFVAIHLVLNRLAGFFSEMLLEFKEAVRFLA